MSIDCYIISNNISLQCTYEIQVHVDVYNLHNNTVTMRIRISMCIRK